MGSAHGQIWKSLCVFDGRHCGAVSWNGGLLDSGERRKEGGDEELARWDK